jgi:hypothetical protein
MRLASMLPHAELSSSPLEKTAFFPALSLSFSFEIP